MPTHANTLEASQENDQLKSMDALFSHLERLYLPPVNPSDFRWCHTLSKDSRRRYLAPDDICLFYDDYKSGGGDKYKSNSLIFDFKKKLSKGNPYYMNKSNATEEIASWLAYTFSELPKIEQYTFVPIPPSKCRSDINYDPRVINALKRAESKVGKTLDIRELVQTIKSREPEHTSISRKKPEELKEYITINHEELTLPIKRIVLVDDVITTGAQFRACKDLLSEILGPHVQIVGLFICRSVDKPEIIAVNDSSPAQVADVVSPYETVSETVESPSKRLCLTR